MKAKEEKSKDTSKESFCVTGSDKGQKYANDICYIQSHDVKTLLDEAAYVMKIGGSPYRRSVQKSDYQNVSLQSFI